MRTFMYALLGVAVVVLNYYGLHWAFIGLTYPSDGTFIMGFLGLVLLLCADVKLGMWLYGKVNHEKAS